MLLCLYLPSRAQSPQITVSGTYYAIGASGSTKANGTVTLSLQSPIESPSNQTGSSKLLYQIVNGVYSFKLPPGSYTAAYEIQSSPSSLPTSKFTRTWTVPGSGGPYSISDVEVPGSAPFYPLQPTGIAPGSLGQCLSTVTGLLVSWLDCAGVMDSTFTNISVSSPSVVNGTTLNHIATLRSTGSSIGVTDAADHNVFAGITISGAGTTGTAYIRSFGLANCVFTTATTADNLISADNNSSPIGSCRDLGTSRMREVPPGVFVIGKVNTTNSGPGLYPVSVQIERSVGNSLPFMFAAVPACSSSNVGLIFSITDSPTAVMSAIVSVGGGSSQVRLECTQTSTNVYHWVVSANATSVTAAQVSGLIPAVVTSCTDNWVLYRFGGTLGCSSKFTFNGDALSLMWSTNNTHMIGTDTVALPHTASTDILYVGQIGGSTPSSGPRSIIGSAELLNASAGAAARAISGNSSTGASDTASYTSTINGGTYRSMWARIIHMTTGTVNQGSGYSGLFSNTSGAGVIVDFSMYRALPPVTVASTSITNYADFRVQGGPVVGSIGSHYGLKIDPMTHTNTTAVWALYVDSDQSFFGGPIVSPLTTPASSSAAGIQGSVVWDANFVYICVATNTWKRVAITTW